MKVGLRQHKRPNAKRNMIPSLCGFDRKESFELSVFAIYLENKAR